MKKNKSPMEVLVGIAGDPIKCSVFPSGKVEFHVWDQGAMEGDKCQCGKKRLKNYE